MEGCSTHSPDRRLHENVSIVVFISPNGNAYDTFRGNHVMATASIFFHRFYMRKAMPRDAKERSHDTFAFQVCPFARSLPALI